MGLKNKILSELEQNREVSLSGQELARQFGVSRNAVWKAVQALRQEGYDIQSTTNQGYRLVPGCDRLNANEVARYLGDVDLPVYLFDTLDSTNNQAKRILNEQNTREFLVLCEKQTGGRGRYGRSFYSPSGAGLYMTLVTSPGLQLEDVVGITSFAAVCVVKAIRRLTGKTGQIKWVNDVFLDGRKLCGILTEAVSDFETATVSSIIIGIGINLYPSALPGELAEVVGFLEPSHAVKNQLAAEITRELLQYDGSSDYLQEYKKHSLVLGREITYQKNGVWYDGCARDIDTNGGLIVVRADGYTDTLQSGEIHVKLKE